MEHYPDDIYTEPSDVDVDTLRNLGPLRALAGVWTGRRGLDVNPGPDGERRQPFIDRIELHPCDPQTNGPQLLYGLRYHQHVLKPDAPETYHDQVGYWLWEPATGTIIQTLAIPRGQIAMAVGQAAPDARELTLRATADDPSFGIRSAPFLEYAFRTVEYRIQVTVHPDGSWTYEEDTVLQVRGRAEPFHHTDRSTLTKVAEPTPNPLARA